MDIKITKFNPNGKVDVPSSKSYAHRALIAAYILNKKTIIEINQISDDIKTTLNCLIKLGGNFIMEKNKIIFSSCDACPREVILDANESGSTLRFLLPLSAFLCDKVVFMGNERLFKRPLTAYLEYFDKHNVSYCLESNKITIYNKIPVDDLIIEDNVSSQFITGWLFLLAITQKQCRVSYPKNLGSKEYIDMTLEILNEFGIKFQKQNESITFKTIEFNSVVYNVEKDWSQAAFFLVLGAVNGNVIIEGLNMKSRQGDKKIIDALIAAGADIVIEENKIIVNSNPLKGFEFNIEECIDLGPIIFVLAAFCDGQTIIRGYQRLEYKESKRATFMVEELRKCGVDIIKNENEIIINGKNNYITNNEFDSHYDHRIAMALSVFASLNEGVSIIKNSECVNKSYPSFYEHLFSLNTKTKTNI